MGKGKSMEKRTLSLLNIMKIHSISLRLYAFVCNRLVKSCLKKRVFNVFSALFFCICIGENE